NETYKRGRGFTPRDWWDEVSKAANGKSFADFARRYVDGREAIPVDSLLSLAALRVKRDTLREPRLGVSTGTDSAGITVTSVATNGAGAVAGLVAGDRLVSIGDVAITSDSAFDAFRSRYNGTTA